MSEDSRGNELLSVFQAEAITGRKAATWRQDILLRKIPYVKLGRLVRIQRKVIDDMIREGYRPAVETSVK